MDAYDADLVAWAEQQAAAIRRRAANEVDWDNVAEEIEDLARREKDVIASKMAIICCHLLKLAYQPEQASASWLGSIREGRKTIARLIRRHPSLRGQPAKELAEAYADGREDAAEETGLADLPAVCPWTVEQVLDRDFLP